MRVRVSPSTAVFLVLAVGGVACLCVASPRRLYARRAAADLKSAQALWDANGTGTYTIYVASNAHAQVTRGHSVIRVRDGSVLDGHNTNCPDCDPDAFSALTVEGLFDRIEAECLYDFPSQFCHISYHNELGYPIRIDTYPHTRDGVERPSITVESLETRESL